MDERRFLGNVELNKDDGLIINVLEMTDFYLYKNEMFRIFICSDVSCQLVINIFHAIFDRRSLCVTSILMEAVTSSSFWVCVVRYKIVDDAQLFIPTWRYSSNWRWKCTQPRKSQLKVTFPLVWRFFFMY